MSVDTTTWVWNYSQTRGTDRLVLLALADFASVHEGDDVAACWPAKSTLAEMVLMDAKTIRRSLRVAEELGEITSEPYEGWNGRPDRRPNRYTFPHVVVAGVRGGRLTPRRANGGTSQGERGDQPGRHGGTSGSPNPLLEPLKNRGTEIEINEDWEMPTLDEATKALGRTRIASLREQFHPTPETEEKANGTE